MTDHSARIAALSPEQRELLIKRLQEKQTSASNQSFVLPQIIADPDRRFNPFPLTDIQRNYWTGRSGLWDLGTCANVYLEYEIVFQFPEGNGPLNRRALTSWFVRTLGRKYLENKATTFFVERFNIALRRLIERHDMLRAVMLPDGQQRILPQVPPYQVKVVDLRRQSPHRVEAELAKMRECLRYAQAPIDQWPLFEFLVCPLDGLRIRLLVRVDPLIIDGESRGNLIAELNQLLLNPQASLPTLECTYRDYALTWIAFQKSELYQQSRDYWLARLPNLPPAPELPCVQNVSPTIRPHFEFLFLELLEPRAWQQLKDRAARAGLSPSGIALAGFVEVLAVWSREPRFTIGLIGTYHPPMHPQIQDMFGNFNSLALLPVENQSRTFQERAQHLWKQLAVDLDHRYFSGHQVLQELNRRHPSSRATIPVFFNSVIENRQPNHPARRHQGERKTEAHQANLYQLKTIEIGAYIPQVLVVSILQEEEDGSLSCKWQIAKGIFPPGMIQDMLDAYRRLLQRLADDESSWRETTRRLVPPEQLAQQTAINNTTISTPREMLHTLFATRSSQCPSETAVIAGNQSLTYEALYRRSNQIGHYLQRLGARPATLIAVVMEPGIESLVAILGTLASGAAYLPIDPHSPSDHLACLSEQSEVKWVLTQTWLDQSLMWPKNIQRICVDDDERWASENTRPLIPIQTAEDLACVIYTSDSSGQLRGSMLHHQGVVNTILDVNCRWKVGPGDRVLALSPLSFDLSLYDTFGILAAGGTIVMPKAGTMRNPAEWASLIHRHQITIWNSPPALLEMLLAYAAEYPDIALGSLRLVLLSRDRASSTLPPRLLALAEGAQIVELKGMPEASVWSSFHIIGNTDPALVKDSWQPMANQHLYVLDPWLEPRPMWVPGQLYIGGKGLSQGYWKDETQTSTHFIQHSSGERLYRTGELCRFLPGGEFEFLGQERQVVVRGYSVELQQIQTILEQHPAVRECIVVAQEIDSRNRLVTYIVPRRGQTVSAAALRDYIKERLPDYMVPAIFVNLSAMPLTSTGQVNHGALPPPPSDGSNLAVSQVVPRDTLEAYLAHIWEMLLDKRPIEITDNFFDLGGNSFLAARLLTRLQNEFKLKHPLIAFFDKPSIEFLADIIRHQIDSPAFAWENSKLLGQITIKE